MCSCSVKSPYMLKEEVQFWVAAGVDCDLKQRPEDILQHFLEVGQLSLCMVDITIKREKKKKEKQVINPRCTV